MSLIAKSTMPDGQSRKRLFFGRRRRRATREKNDSFSDTTSEGQERTCTTSLGSIESTLPGGCLKVVTQTASLRRTYEAQKEATTSTTEADAGAGVKKTVQFSSLEIHTHPIELGDNPAVSAGPPLQLGWKSMASQQVSIDEYEKFQPSRRSRSQLLAPVEVRVEWLRHAGYSRSEVTAAAEEAKMIRVQRQRSLPLCLPFRGWARKLAVKRTATV